MKFSFQIVFDLAEHHSLIDAIHQSQGLYIGYGNEGDKVSDKKDEMILMEVPNMNTETLWNNTLTEIVRKQLKKGGIPKKDLKKETQNFIVQMREILKIRNQF